MHEGDDGCVRKSVLWLIISGAAETVMPRRNLRDQRVEKGFKGQEDIKNCRQQVMSVRTCEGFVGKSTWQMSDVRRSHVSASHVIQAGNDLFTEKNEAYVVNREKKKEKKVLRKERNVSVLDLYVKVPAGATAHVDDEPMEVDTINQVADGRRHKEQSEMLACETPVS